MANTEKSTGSRSGKVYLVGAGPGDPGLITMRGVECLRQADVVLCDYLVDPAILQHAPAGAEKVRLGHHQSGQQTLQEQITARLLQEARRGKTVVRLKGGDPDIFGRSADETAALRAAGIPFEIVPGVTAALAAAGYAEIPLTDADYASAVALVTGQQRHGEGRPPLDYAALARFPGTLVLYMGITSAPQWSRALLDAGKSPETPVAIVRRCSWPDQSIVRCTLGTVAEVIERQKLRPPGVIVVGEVVRSAPQVSWFAARPLCGVRVMVTRPRDEAEPLREALTALGAEVMVQPAIEIADPPDWQPVDAALACVDQYDWLVFSSVHGVRYLLQRLLGSGGDLRRLGRARLAVIGPGTADELARYHLRADLMPAQYRAEALAEALTAEAAGRRFLLLRASRGREVLAEGLIAAGAAVEQIVVYSSIDVEQPDPEIAAALSAGRIDWITVSSSAIARSLVRMFGEDLRRARLASISPVTSGVLRQLGFAPAAEATDYTMDGLVAAIVRAI